LIMKRNIYISIFIILLIVPTISWGILNVLNISDPKIMETIDFDLNEKRLKATLSETINLDNVNVEYENYYNDRIPFRSVLITTKKNIDSSIEAPYKNSLEKTLLKIFSKRKEIEASTLYSGERDGRAYRCFDQAVDLFFNHALAKDDIDPYDPSIDYPLKLSDNSRVVIGQSDWLYLYGSNIDYYTGKKSLASASEIKDREKLYLKLNDVLKKHGKKLVIYICPEKEEIYPEYMATYEFKDKTELPIYIRDYIKASTDINYIYQKEDFLREKQNYILYKKYDSHWNTVGAYLALNSIKEALGLEAKSLYDLDLEKYREEIALGDLIPFGNISSVNFAPNIEYKILNYKDDCIVTEDVVVDAFDKPAKHTTCDKGAPESALLIGDSYSVAVADHAKKEFKDFYYTSFSNLDKDFVADWIKASDDIIILVVERNENVVVKYAADTIMRVLN